MRVSDYLEKYTKNKENRKLSSLNEDGIKKIISTTDKSVWNSMEDLFGNLFTNFQGLYHHLENSNINDSEKDAIINEIAKNISIILTIKEYFTEAKEKLR